MVGTLSLCPPYEISLHVSRSPDERSDIRERTFPHIASALQATRPHNDPHARSVVAQQSAGGRRDPPIALAAILNKIGEFFFERLAMPINKDKVDDTALALLYLTLHTTIEPGRVSIGAC